MKLLDTRTKSIIEVSDSYGSRLIEQGRAVLVRNAKKPEAKKTAEAAENGKKRTAGER